ncbi:hypothetical protein K491DRAFT_279922 [Lophiostoma macrostomum CBS 122681]|uniref:Uncharacterized protein n=1 Tax=Lophiostoma macrostomum CBS 122681 TaxID=1314788 RepID=A0A6A6TRP5_9PLEO|nr:hypothetical protein K491DRAFT_279922 [Lophiostoma macrostomum CBS 122681]
MSVSSSNSATPSRSSHPTRPVPRTNPSSCTTISCSSSSSCPKPQLRPELNTKPKLNPILNPNIDPEPTAPYGTYLSLLLFLHLHHARSLHLIRKTYLPPRTDTPSSNLKRTWSGQGYQTIKLARRNKKLYRPYTTSGAIYLHDIWCNIETTYADLLSHASVLKLAHMPGMTSSFSNPSSFTSTFASSSAHPHQPARSISTPVIPSRTSLPNPSTPSNFSSSLSQLRELRREMQDSEDFMYSVRMTMYEVEMRLLGEAKMWESLEEQRGSLWGMVRGNMRAYRAFVENGRGSGR